MRIIISEGEQKCVSRIFSLKKAFLNMEVIKKNKIEICLSSFKLVFFL